MLVFFASLSSWINNFVILRFFFSFPSFSSCVFVPLSIDLIYFSSGHLLFCVKKKPSDPLLQLFFPTKTTTAAATEQLIATAESSSSSSSKRQLTKRTAVSCCARLLFWLLAVLCFWLLLIWADRKAAGPCGSGSFASYNGWVTMSWPRGSPPY